jgi:hypothetical protein
VRVGARDRHGAHAARRGERDQVGDVRVQRDVGQIAMFEAEPPRHRDRELIGRDRAALEQHLSEQLTRRGRNGDCVLNRGAVAKP